MNAFELMKKIGFGINEDLPHPWDISTAVYDSKSFDPSEDQYPLSVFIKPDGAKIYICGNDTSSGTDKIYQYTLSTPWDISTASYDSKSFDVNPRAIFIKPDGTKIYILGLGAVEDAIYQYTLSTPWDISTASYDSKSFDVSSQSVTSNGMFFKSDGTKVYVYSNLSDAIYQYTLSTPWDISTASYDSKSFDVSSQDTLARAIFIKPDGAKVYICGDATDAIYQYTLSTPWDISTASYDSKKLDITNPLGIFFKTEGEKVYINSNNIFYQYSVG